MEEVYIPGDLVYWYNNLKCKVTSIERGLVSEVISKDGHLQNIGPIGRTHIKPIPITPAILEDNGWIYHYDVWAEKGIVVLSQNADSTWEVLYKMPKFGRPLGNTQVIDSKNPLCEIRYVHQLQHLLFGLGLDSSLKV